MSVKLSRDDAKRPSGTHTGNRRGWILAAVLVLLVAAGGLILNHLRQHPIVPQAAVPQGRTAEETGAPDMAAMPPPEISGKPEPSTSLTVTTPTGNIPDQNSSPPPAPVPKVEIRGESGSQAPAPERVDDMAAKPPAPNHKRFRELLSRGLVALHNRQYREARDALIEAASIDPESNDVRDALYQLDQALKLEQLDRLQRLAIAAEQDGNWPKALDMYLAALTIDPNVGFALQGRQRSIGRITIARRIDFFLTQPETLFNDRHLENAVQLLLDARQIEPRDPGLEADLSQLDQLVIAAQTPVRVILTSDNQTDVVVYRVSRLGRFGTHELFLRPGPYTVVGVRDGYRDVRLNVTVNPGATHMTVRVVCQEEIQQP